jgi:hypothetical protein
MELNAQSELRNGTALDSRAYNFVRLRSQGNAAKQVTGDLSASGAGKVLTFADAPEGLVAGGYVYLVGGTGSAEAALITASTCAIRGGGSGTITVTTAATHTGSWRVTSATAGIQEAVNVASANNTGGDVVVPAGKHAVHAPVTIKCNGISIRGEGHKSKIISAHATHNLFVFDGPNTTSSDSAFTTAYINQCRLSDLYFAHNTLDKTAGYAVYVNKGDNFLAENLTGYDWPTFIGVTETNSIHFNHCSSYIMRPTTGRFAYINGGSDLFMTDCYASGNMLTPPEGGILIDKHGGFYLINCSMFATGTGLVLIPTGGDTVQNGFLKNNAWDSCAQNGISIIPTGSGSTVRAIESTGDRNGANRHNSILIAPSAGAIVQGISINNFRGILSHRDGLLITDDGTCTVRDIGVHGSRFGMNAHPFVKSSADTISGLANIVVDGSGLATCTLYYTQDLVVGTSITVAGCATDTDLNGTYTVITRVSDYIFTFQTASVAAGTYTDVGMSVRLLGLHSGIHVACAVTNLSITDNMSGPVEEGTADYHDYEIRLDAVAIPNLLVANNILAGGVTAKMIDASTSKHKVIASNVGISNDTATLVAAASVTLGVQDKYYVSGTTAIATINGGYYGRRVMFIFTDASPGGVTTGGNIAKAQAATTNDILIGEFVDTDGWYFK